MFLGITKLIHISILQERFIGIFKIDETIFRQLFRLFSLTASNIYQLVPKLACVTKRNVFELIAH